MAPVRADQRIVRINEEGAEVQVREFEVNQLGGLSRAGEIAFAEAVKAYHKKVENLVANRQRAISMMMESLS